MCVCVRARTQGCVHSWTCTICVRNKNPKSLQVVQAHVCVCVCVCGGRVCVCKDTVGRCVAGNNAVRSACSRAM